MPMETIEKYRLQVEVAERLYLNERSRRETVRSALTIPLAVLTFAAFGFGAFGSEALWSTAGPAAFSMSLASILLAFLAFCFFIWAVIDLQRVDYGSHPIDPAIIDFMDNAEKTAAEMRELGIEDSDSDEAATVGALDMLAESYLDCYDMIEYENRVNLDLQKAVFGRLILGLGMLITAILLSAALRLAPVIAAST